MRAARKSICAAMLDLVYTQGYEATSVEQVLERAGASREEFDRLFADKEECAMAVFDHFLEDFEGKARRAYEAEAGWPDNLRAAAYALARWVEENPRGMHFGTIEMLWVSEVAQARREVAFQSFADMIDAGRAEAANPAAIPAFNAEAAIGSIAETFTKRLQRPDLDPYVLVRELMYVAVLPYLGEEAAARELRTVPPSPERDDGA